MGNKSDPRSDASDRRISATEASRSFSSLLDEVDAGRRFVVHRHGRDVCAIVPAPARGRRASECMEILGARDQVVLDEGFGDDLLEVIGAEPVEERPSWDS